MEKSNKVIDFIEVDSIEEIEQVEDVYDIEVKDNHNFFANGLLVHNCQHLTNYHLIECAKRTGAKLVVTADSHYSRPDHWKEREIYRLMSRMSFMKDEEFNLPKSVDELKCELYPKNASQIWDTYLETGKAKFGDIYDDKLICEAIERTHDIAHNQIGNVEMDKSTKLPSITKLVTKTRLKTLQEALRGISTNEDDLAFEQLKSLTIEGARWRGVADKQEYIDRLKNELEVVKHLKFSKYFLTYNKIMKLIGEKCLTGPGRGSAAGSALAYVLDITQIDPIKHGLLFSRFLSKQCQSPLPSLFARIHLCRDFEDFSRRPDENSPCGRGILYGFLNRPSSFPEWRKNSRWFFAVA